MNKQLYQIRILLITFLFSFLNSNSYSQDIEYARSVIDSLSSPMFQGRGYVFSGDKYSAKYIANELKRLNVQPLCYQYKQSFNLAVNTFPGNMEVKINDIVLKPGADYIITPYSSGIKGTFQAAWLTQSIISNQSKLEEFMKGDYSQKVIVVERYAITDQNQIEIAETMRQNPLKAKAVIFITKDKLIWGTSNKIATYTIIEIKSAAISKKFKEISLDIENQFLENYSTQNILGYVEGSLFPDSIIVFAAHYDHLGRMGSKTYFPGANDNASGVAMLLNLAQFYGEADNQPQYTIAFMFFSGEEDGLAGSTYFTENPVVPLKRIKFLVNLDLVGTGDEGIKVVNGTLYPEQFKNLTLINNQFNYLKDVGKRGEAANSDHYPFYKKGIKSFFIYTLGGPDDYHNIYDKSSNLPLTKFENLFLMLTDFVETF